MKIRPSNERRTQGGIIADIFKPGETVTVSGIYSVILEGGDNEGRSFDAIVKFKNQF
ncbi:hypothetical protein PQR01_27840 [Paraburkholderia rhynchosiae]|uniref:Uncharacterized protein n=1 Tax=Paraburkholderia rhynchosiae TaxID=487049 RepID=A0ACC7NIT7_9BURK